MASRRPAGELNPRTRRSCCHGGPPQAAASGGGGGKQRRSQRRCRVAHVLGERHARVIQPGAILLSLCTDVAQHRIGGIQPCREMQMGRHGDTRHAIGITCRQRRGDDQGESATDAIDARAHRPGPGERASEARRQHETPDGWAAFGCSDRCPGSRQQALHCCVPWLDKGFRQAPMHEIADCRQLAVEARRALHGAHGQLNRCTADAANGCRRLAGCTSMRTAAPPSATLAV